MNPVIDNNDKTNFTSYYGNGKSFTEIAGDSFIAKALENVSTHISSYSNGQFFNITTGGPAIQGFVIKHDNSYFSIIIITYSQPTNIYVGTVTNTQKWLTIYYKN